LQYPIEKIEKLEKKESGTQLVLNSNGAYTKPNLEELLIKYNDPEEEIITISKKEQIPTSETRE
jgi:hypothetical protein